MIERRKKLCRKCGKPKYLFGKGLCDFCYKIEFSSMPQKGTKIKPISKKQQKRNKKYLELRFIYLRDNPICEVKDCTHHATEIHHKKGRVGDALYDNFLAVCSEHHRKIEENPLWAKLNGYSASRIKE